MTGKRAKYPHLLPEDCDIWDRFLSTYPHKYTQFEYDVRVGHGRDPGPTDPPKVRDHGLALSFKRLDVVAFREGSPTIIEITASAGLKAVGQLVSYPILFQQTYPTATKPPAILIAAALQTDIDTVLRHLGIQFIII